MNVFSTIFTHVPQCQISFSVLFSFTLSIFSFLSHSRLRLLYTPLQRAHCAALDGPPTPKARPVYPSPPTPGRPLPIPTRCIHPRRSLAVYSHGLPVTVSPSIPLAPAHLRLPAPPLVIYCLTHQCIYISRCISFLSLHFFFLFFLPAFPE